MTKSFFYLVFLILATPVVLSQQKGGSGRIPNKSREQLLKISYDRKESLRMVLDDDGYLLELFPGQRFDGWYYYWAVNTPHECNIKENPNVPWLTINPSIFTSTGCTDIIPVKFSFIAPMTEGVYLTMVKDSLGYWDSVRVELKVTKSPENYRLRKFGVNKEILNYRDYLQYLPWNWDNNTCVQDYLPCDSILYSFYINSDTKWLKISPSAGKIFRDKTKDYQLTIVKTEYDSVWVSLEKQYYAYPEFYHCYVKETEPKDYLMHFDGQNIVTTDYYPGGSSSTLMYWVRFDTISTQCIGAHDFENHRFYLGIQSNKTLFAGMGNSFTPVTNLNIIPKKWYHMTLTRSVDLDSAYVYINATEVSRFAYTFSGESKVELFIGARSDSNNDITYPLKGIIDEVQVWERPLSRNEIIQYMFSPPKGDEPALAIYYSFNDGWGNFTKNAVDNYYYGLTIGEPEWIHSIAKPESLSELMTSVEEYFLPNENRAKLLLYPNPASESVSVQFSAPDFMEEHIIRVYDINGKIVLENKSDDLNPDYYTLNTSNLAPGMYRIVVSKKSGRQLARSALIKIVK